MTHTPTPTPVHATIDHQHGKPRLLLGCAQPTVGAPTSMAQSLALALCATARHMGYQVEWMGPTLPIAAFAAECLSPEGYGHAVTSEVRRAAAQALRGTTTQGE